MLIWVKFADKPDAVAWICRCAGVTLLRMRENNLKVKNDWVEHLPVGNTPLINGAPSIDGPPSIDGERGFSKVADLQRTFSIRPRSFSAP